MSNLHGHRSDGEKRKGNEILYESEEEEKKKGVSALARRHTKDLANDILPRLEHATSSVAIRLFHDATAHAPFP